MTLDSFVGMEYTSTQTGKYCDELLVGYNNVTLDSFVGIDPRRPPTRGNSSLVELLVEYNNTGRGGGGVIGIAPATSKRDTGYRILYYLILEKFKYLADELLVKYNHTGESVVDINNCGLLPWVAND